MRKRGTDGSCKEVYKRGLSGFVREDNQAHTQYNFFIHRHVDQRCCASDITILHVLVREVKLAMCRYYGTNIKTATTVRCINLRSQVNTVAIRPCLRLDKQDDWSKKSISGW